ncbi:MAG: hypothetical protein AAFQ51_13645 [Pseudomonadota bacterium]
MSQKTPNPALTFLLGASLVAVIGLTAYIYTDGFGEEQADISIELPDISAEG